MKDGFDLHQQEHQLRVRAGQVMAEIKARGEDWQASWRSHPVAIAYRELLKRAWAEPHRPGADHRYHWSAGQGIASDARLTQPEGSQATGSATPDRPSSSLLKG